MAWLFSSKVEQTVARSLVLFAVGAPLPPQAPLSPEGVEEVRRADCHTDSTH